MTRARRDYVVSLGVSAALASGGGAIPACSHPVVAATASTSCPAGAFPIAGVCLSREDAAAYCGKGARPEGGGCQPTACDEDRPVDLGSGACMPLRSLQELVARRGATLPDAGLGCRAESELVAEGDSFACLPRETLCGRGARFSAGACRADLACPRDSILDDTGACVRVIAAGNERVLDVGAWIRLVLGADGGEGTAAICAPLRARPWRVGIAAHGTAIVDVHVELSFPDNVVSAAQAEVTARRHFDPHDLDSAVPVSTAKLTDPLWTALRGLGGVANASTATVEVHCTVDGGSDAAGVVPASKDAPARGRSGKPTS